MRTCEHGICIKPANWRSKAYVGNMANPHTMALCEEHRAMEGIPTSALIQISPIEPETKPATMSQAKPFVAPPSLNPFGG